MTLSLREIAIAVGNTQIKLNDVVSGISVDSRSTKPGDLFCAVIGANVDGHDFVDQAIKNGAVAVLASKQIVADVPVIKVSDVVTGLSQIALEIRSRFSGDVFGVTGSVGKTTVKELLYAGLGGEEIAMRTPGNLNSEYGVPMSWMNLKPFHRYAVIEMGMRGIGHIAHICEFSKPNIGIITAIGLAHVGVVGSRERIIEAKGELITSLPKNGTAILPTGKDFDVLASMTNERKISFGENADVNLNQITMDVESNLTIANYSVFGHEVTAKLPGVGKGIAMNAAAVLAATYAIGLKPTEVSDRLASAELPMDRLHSVRVGDKLLLVDVYNSSPESCIEALNVLSQVEREKIAILGDMLELGNQAEAQHRRIGAEVAKSGVTKLYLVGQNSKWIGEEAKSIHGEIEIQYFEDSEQARSVFDVLRGDNVILVKGSRSMKMENALKGLGVRI